MSQFFIQSSGGSGPTVPTQFTTDYGIDGGSIVTPGTATPSGNNLNVLGGSGIETYSDPDTQDYVYIEIQNSCTKTGTTVGATTTDLCSIELTTAGTYVFESRVSGWETGGALGVGYAVNGTILSDGVTATVIGDSDGFAHKSIGLENANVEILASGLNSIIRVTGVADTTINWAAFTVYINVGVL